MKGYKEQNEQYVEFSNNATSHFRIQCEITNNCKLSSSEHDLLNLICTNFQQQLLGELFQSSLPYRVHSRANSCFMTFLELSTSKRSFVNILQIVVSKQN
ncbi:Hypothetical_protein [Hexamita inflata]|uniref:Hypothetical_protein n=1 Tax=Hexamita inflata TaxID=28002 RepID=A0AA86PV25_9EUKA|nr:Hypothetical protein HINF_LOCUS34490 [Hexamita inflata]